MRSAPPGKHGSSPRARALNAPGAPGEADARRERLPPNRRSRRQATDLRAVDLPLDERHTGAEAEGRAAVQDLDAHGGAASIRRRRVSVRNHMAARRGGLDAGVTGRRLQRDGVVDSRMLAKASEL